MIACSNRGVRDLSSIIALYADLLNDTNFESRLFNPSTAFHDADMGVEESVATALFGSNVVATNGVIDNFWICSITSRRVEVGENPRTTVKDDSIAIAMNHDRNCDLLDIIVDAYTYVGDDAGDEPK